MPRRCGVVARRPGAVASAALLALLIAGCSVLSDDGAAPSRLPVDDASESGTSFPNLGSIPDAPPRALSAEERQAVVEELRKDRANADGGAGASADPAPDPAPGEGVDTFAD